MIYRHVFEAINKTLRDFMKTVDLLLEKKPFERKVIVFEGDFCQILSIVIKGSHEDIVGSCLQRSIL